MLTPSTQPLLTELAIPTKILPRLAVMQKILPRLAVMQGRAKAIPGG
jgi:hypothetical protein